jgi:hypothetical protein
MRALIQAQLSASLPPKLVDELLEAHAEAKQNFYLGGLRLSEVEGGRFCEAAFRLLEHITTSTFSPLGRHLNTEQIIQALERLPSASFSDSIRIHIPRALRLVYDIRNKRDAAHLADGIDPNVQDATLVVSVIDWVLAEFLRMYHSVSPDEAHSMVDQIVTRVAPVIQDFSGFLKVLNPKLAASDHCLVLLYQRGTNGCTFEELLNWSRRLMRPNLKRTLRSLVEEKAFAHFDLNKYYITRTGQNEVESRKLLNPL